MIKWAEFEGRLAIFGSRLNRAAFTDTEYLTVLDILRK